MNRILLPILLLAGLAFAAPAPAATTLMVNGDTPSVRWQRVVDRAHVPTPDGRVTLFLAECPGADPEIFYGCTTMAGPPTIWIQPQHPGAAETLLHMLGHQFDFAYLTDADRADFMRLSRSRATGWRESPSVGGIPGEMFAFIYATCATYRKITARVVFEMGMTWDDAEIMSVRQARRYVPRLYASCMLIRQAGARHLVIYY